MGGIHRTFHRRLPNGIFLWGAVGGLVSSASLLNGPDL